MYCEIHACRVISVSLLEVLLNPLWQFSAMRKTDLQLMLIEVL